MLCLRASKQVRAQRTTCEAVAMLNERYMADCVCHDVNSCTFADFAAQYSLERVAKTVKSILTYACVHPSAAGVKRGASPDSVIVSFATICRQVDRTCAQNNITYVVFVSRTLIQSCLSETVTV